MPVLIVTIARWGSTPSVAAVKTGRRLSPQLTFTTGLSVRHAPTRARNSAGTSPAQSASVRLGSALETTTRARMKSPPSSVTPSPGHDGANGYAGRDDRAGLPCRIGERERDAAHAAVDVTPAAVHAVEVSEGMVGMDARGSRVAGAGVGADDALTVQRGTQALVAHVALDDVGDRCLEHHLDRLLVVAEARFDLVACGRVPEPGVVLGVGAAERAADPREQVGVGEVAVDVGGRERVEPRPPTAARSSHSASDVPSSNGHQRCGSASCTR